jgi:hypothetical protein
VEKPPALRATMLRALRAKKYIVTEEQTGNFVIVNDGTRPMRWLIPPVFDRRFLNETINHFQIPKEWIDNPLMIPGDEEKSEPC